MLDFTVDIDMDELDRLAAAGAATAPDCGQSAAMCITFPLVPDLSAEGKELSLIRSSLRMFEEDWDAPGMDAYDAL